MESEQPENDVEKEAGVASAEAGEGEVAEEKPKKKRYRAVGLKTRHRLGRPPKPGAKRRKKPKRPRKPKEGEGENAEAAAEGEEKKKKPRRKRQPRLRVKAEVKPDEEVQAKFMLIPCPGYLAKKMRDVAEQNFWDMSQVALMGVRCMLDHWDEEERMRRSAWESQDKKEYERVNDEKVLVAAERKLPVGYAVMHQVCSELVAIDAAMKIRDHRY